MIHPPARHQLLLLLLFIVLPWVIYASNLQGKYVFDDITGIVDTDAVHGMHRVGDMLRFWTESDVNYRPLRYFSYAVDYTRGNGAPRAFHETNIVLHGLCAVALWVLLLQILPDRRLAVWATLLWIVHPLQVESVAYISGRKDLLATLFYVIALIGALQRSRATNARGRIAGSVLFLVAAMLSFLAKESSLTLPATAFGLDVLLQGEHSWRERVMSALRRGRVFYGLILTAGSAALFYNLVIESGTTVQYDLLRDPIQNVGDSIRSWSLYLRKAVIPWPLVADLRGLFPRFLGTNGGFGVAWNGGGSAATLAGLVFGACFLLFSGKQRRLVASALGFYLLLALPVANLVPLNEPAAEHFAYLPLIALAVAMAAMARGLAARFRVPHGRFLACTVLCVLALSSAMRSRVWADSETLWDSVLTINDGSDRAWSNMGLVYLERGDRPAAMRAFRRASELAPTVQPRIVANLMQMMRTDGDLPGAIALGQRALTAKPEDGLLLSFTGQLLLQANQPAEALPLLDQVAVFEDGPDEAAPGWMRDRAIAHALTGDNETAESVLRTPADGAAPDLATLGWVLLRQEKWAEAESTLRAATRDPRASALTWRSLGVALFRLGRAEEASVALDEAEARGDQVPVSLRDAVADALRGEGKADPPAH